MEQLEELNAALHVSDASGAFLHIDALELIRALPHSAAQLQDLGDSFRNQRLAEHEGFEGVDELTTKGGIDCTLPPEEPLPPRYAVGR